VPLGTLFLVNPWSSPVKTMKAAAVAATLILAMSGAAFADLAGRADTSDPNSAPLASSTGGPARYTNDGPARANTADPGSALAHDPRGPYYNESLPIRAARAAAINECSRREAKFLDRLWGVTEVQIYRACMADHGQSE
jgi:hypothetical protein